MDNSRIVALLARVEQIEQDLYAVDDISWDRVRELVIDAGKIHLNWRNRND